MAGHFRGKSKADDVDLASFASIGDGLSYSNDPN